MSVVAPEAFGWEVWLYFFIGGVAGGAVAAASVANLARDGRERALVMRATILAVPLIVASLGLLTLDLGRPERLLNLLTVWRPTSPLWWGSWVLGVSVAAYALLFLRARDARTGLGALERALLWANIVLSGALVVYTGVLLGTSSRPLWSATPLVPVIFALSALSTGIAALVLVSRRRAGRVIEDLEHADAGVLVMESLAIALLLGWLVWAAGPVGARAAQAVLSDGAIAVVFWVGVVGIGLLLPLVAALPRIPALVAWRPFLVLLGGLALRFVIVVGGQATPPA